MMNVCSTALWESRTSEAGDLFEDYKFYFNKYDVDNKGRSPVTRIFMPLLFSNDSYLIHFSFYLGNRQNFH